MSIKTHAKARRGNLGDSYQIKNCRCDNGVECGCTCEIKEAVDAAEADGEDGGSDWEVS